MKQTKQTMLRVIAGQAKGCKLVTPQGDATRPTPERVREALFSMLYSLGPLGRGLDAYAGSGAIGIEALSRGATSVTFVEPAPPAQAALAANLGRLPAACRARARLVPGALLPWLARPNADAPFDWAFVDPPFALDAYAASLAALAGGGWTHADTTLVVEHASARPPPEQAAWALSRSRRFGSVALSFYGRLVRL